MKILKFKSLFVLIVIVALLTGCKDDPAPEVSPFAGNFIITKATILAITPAINTKEIGPLPLPAGIDITAAIQAALLSQVECNPDKTWVELREDNSMYMSCEGASAFNAGTWEEVSDTELKLNMNSAAIPSSPTGIVLNVIDIVKSSTGWTGKTTVPMPKEMFAEMLAEFKMTIADTPAIYSVNFSLDFVKK